MGLLSDLHLDVEHVIRNAPPARLYQYALQWEGSAIASSGALVAYSGTRTGRSPTDKRIIEEPETRDDVWWGPVNIKLDRRTFDINRERAVDYLNTRAALYVVDGYAGWDPKHRLKIRVVTARAYHALFMQNMLVRPSPEELESFDEPDLFVLNAGRFPANRFTTGMTSTTSVDLSFADRTLVVLGTEYAGEMKKGVFTVVSYLMPKRGLLSMHCAATEGRDGDVSLLFGLDGSGKTTLSAAPNRRLIGDDEHVWSEDGIFNVEGGCHASVRDLSEAESPEIWSAIRFGAVLENVVYDEESHEVDFGDVAITRNVRAAYPLEHVPHAKLPALGAHPRHVVFLTCDAFGVLPLVSRLTLEQAIYHFISGYSARLADSEVGVEAPEATFSPCFAGPFLVWHPARYAALLAARLAEHRSEVWLVNTGWSGGSPASGPRTGLAIVRAVLDAIHSGALAGVGTFEEPVFGLQVPEAVPGVPGELLDPRAAWLDVARYEATTRQLVAYFQENFAKYEDDVDEAIVAAGPRLPR